MEKILIHKQVDRFTGEPHGGRWFHWTDVESCFWPGPGRRSVNVNAELAAIRDSAGVYFLAVSGRQPRLSPAAAPIKYIGETGWFQRRMAQFGTSAGFWAQRRNGHSAGWRWNYGKEALWVCFVPLGMGLQPHVARGFRCWQEGLALEEYRLKHGSLPEVNLRLKSSEIGTSA